jgi:hypothetical protein
MGLSKPSDYSDRSEPQLTASRSDGATVPLLQQTDVPNEGFAIEVSGAAPATDISARTAAGVGTGVVACLLGGPVVAVLVGLGATYAHDKYGSLGDASRKAGEMALKLKHKAEQLNEKHHIVSTTHKFVTRAQKTNPIVKKTGTIVVSSLEELAAFIERHNLMDRGVQQVGKGTFWVAEKIVEQLGGRSSQAHAEEEHQDATYVQVSSME